MKLVWNAIVKNELAILPRCVRSIMPFIDGAIVVDTGSTDSSVEILQSMFAAAGKPLELSSAPFVSFEHARNEALRCARLSRMEYDYLLLTDADMTLVADDFDWATQLNGGAAYDIRQQAGNLSYWNRRLLHRSSTATYKCPTHEFLDVPAAGRLAGIWFLDHADGANRPNKLWRDVVLLERFLETETNEGLVQRAHFYLAGTCYDLGKFEKAAKHYAVRAEMGGFDEEFWYARFRYALCLLNLGDLSGFVWKMLAGWQQRPHRAETLHSLAKFFRERGDNHASLLFSEPGMRLPYPKDDLLFVSDCRSALREEFAICAYYDPSRRERGSVACSQLALNGSEQARRNQYWYLKPLIDVMPSFHATHLRLDAPLQYVFTNPSVVNYRGRPLVLLRAVNYRIAPDGSYGIHDLDGNVSPANPIRTRNFLWDSAHGGVLKELALPGTWPKDAQYGLVRGFEDSRLFEWRGRLWTLSTVRELNPEGWCEAVLAPMEPWGYGESWKKILVEPRAHQKNWAPWVKDDELRFVYRPGTLVDVRGNVGVERNRGLAVGRISGGSQVVEADGAYLALVHEAGVIPGRSNRYYSHRFIKYEEDGAIGGMSLPFVFFDRCIEFAAGLAYFPERRQLMLSFGVMDREAWTATVDVDEVLAFVGKLEG